MAALVPPRVDWEYSAIHQFVYCWTTRGLTADPGFQFKAVSPGLRTDVLGEIERSCGTRPAASVAFIRTVLHTGEAVMAQKMLWPTAAGRYQVHGLVGNSAALDLALCVRLFYWRDWLSDDVSTLHDLGLDDLSAQELTEQTPQLPPPELPDDGIAIADVIRGEVTAIDGSFQEAYFQLGALAQILPRAYARDISFSVGDLKGAGSGRVVPGRRSAVVGHDDVRYLALGAQDSRYQLECQAADTSLAELVPFARLVAGESPIRDSEEIRNLSARGLGLLLNHERGATSLLRYVQESDSNEELAVAGTLLQERPLYGLPASEVRTIMSMAVESLDQRPNLAVLAVVTVALADLPPLSGDFFEATPAWLQGLYDHVRTDGRAVIAFPPRVLLEVAGWASVDKGSEVRASIIAHPTECGVLARAFPEEFRSALVGMSASTDYFLPTHAALVATGASDPASMCSLALELGLAPPFMRWILASIELPLESILPVETRLAELVDSALGDIPSLNRLLTERVGDARLDGGKRRAKRSKA